MCWAGLQRDRWNRSAVEWACVNGHAGALRLLIAKSGAAAVQGAKISAQKHHKRTHGRLQPPLHLAVWRATTSAAVETPSQPVADGFGQARGKGQAFAEVAAEEDDEGGLGCVELLLAAGADVNALDETRATVLHVAAAAAAAQEVTSAAKARAMLCCRLLLEKGADPAAEDSEGRTPAQLAPEGMLAAAAAVH